MSPICGKCGDKGWEETLICCYMCHDVYEHRYCFNKASDIFKIDVKWACEDCFPTVRKNDDFATKTVGEISPPSAKRKNQENESDDKAVQLESPIKMAQ